MKIPGLFITATDTGVGKTYFASAIARRLRDQSVRVGAYKPVASGSIRDARGGPVWGDVEALSSALGREFDPERICPQRFHAALAPPVAAHQEGGAVDPHLLRSGATWWETQVDFLFVEGA